MSNIVRNYFIILEDINSLGFKLEYNSRIGIKDKTSYLQGFTISFTTQFILIDYENSFFKQII